MDDMRLSGKKVELTQAEAPFELHVVTPGNRENPEQILVFDDVASLVAHIRTHDLPEGQAYTLEGLDLSWQSFYGADLSFCHFKNCRMLGVDFSDTLLEDVLIDHCDLRDADFRHARMYNIVSRHGQFDGARFECVEIKGFSDKSSRMVGANFSGGDIAFVQLDKTDISECDFTGAEIDTLQLNRVRARAVIFANLVRAKDISIKQVNFLNATLSEQFRRATKWVTTFDPRVSASHLQKLRRRPGPGRGAGRS